MRITLNGQPHELPGEQATVAQLVEQLGMTNNPVAVEVNRQVIPKAQHADHALAESDTVEVVTLVGGG